VTLKIYDEDRQLVNTLHEGMLGPGAMWFRWSNFDRDGRRIPSGVYFARFEVHGTHVDEQIVIVRQ
jgi:hypothetical protein